MSCPLSRKYAYNILYIHTLISKFNKTFVHKRLKYFFFLVGPSYIFNFLSKNIFKKLKYMTNEIIDNLLKSDKIQNIINIIIKNFIILSNILVKSSFKILSYLYF